MVFSYFYKNSIWEVIISIKTLVKGVFSIRTTYSWSVYSDENYTEVVKNYPSIDCSYKKNEVIIWKFEVSLSKITPPDIVEKMGLEFEISMNSY